MGEYKADDRFGWLGNGLPFNIAPRKIQRSPQTYW